MSGFTVSLTAALFCVTAALTYADTGKPNLTGKWASANKDLVLLIEQQGQDIHIKETRGADPQDDVTEFTCGATGKECAMRDGKEKASVSVYYNGPVLVVWKTHGRHGAETEKRRLSLSPEGNSLIVEVMHINPDGKPEKLVLSRQE